MDLLINPASTIQLQIYYHSPPPRIGDPRMFVFAISRPVGCPQRYARVPPASGPIGLKFQIVQGKL